MAPGELFVCEGCERQLYAVYPELGHVRRPEDAPVVVESIDPPRDVPVVHVDGTGIAVCPGCGAANKLLD